MAKKTETTTKSVAPAKRAAKAPKAEKPAIIEKPIVAEKPAVVKTAVAPKTKAPKAAKPKAPAYTADDVALRAYFISEKRRNEGLTGDEHQDWLEAERQLVAESTRPKRAKKA